MEINPLRVTGNWRDGWALDVHTTSSTRRTDGGFDNVYSPLGKALNQCKYHQDFLQVDMLADAVSEFLLARRILPRIHAIIPMPPSDTSRSFQPVQEIAKRVAEGTGLSFAPDFLVKVRSTPALKNLDDPQSRRQELEGVFRVDDLSLAGTWVVLFDDVFRSGETLRAATEAALTQGKVGKVYVLTLTKTRTNR
jgi:predicted amidophosphoribosyltransferase